MTNSEELNRRPPPLGSTISLFVTCVIDQFRPNVAHGAVSLLRSAGYRVEVPVDQTCCGQPALSAGYPDDARRLAIATIRSLRGCRAVVVPSGSCAAMLKGGYRELLAGTKFQSEASLLEEHTWELTELLDLVHPAFAPATAPLAGQSVSVHDSCHGLRELGLKTQSRSLLQRAGFRVTEMSDPEVCCGFGGVFSALLPEVSTAMADDKIRMAAEAAPIVVGTDMACLLHIEGRAIATRRTGEIRFAHVAELLADALDGGDGGGIG